MKIKRLLLILGKFLMGIIVFLLLWVVAALLLPQIKMNKNFHPYTGDDCITMYVRSNGMHTDVVFPVQSPERDWRKAFPIEIYKGVDSTFSYVAIGWGDKGFYLETPTWADLKVSTTLKASVGASGSAMHIVYLPSPPSIDDSYGKQLKIAPDQYRKMLNFIDNAFVKDKNDHIVLIKHPNYDENDNYYEAKGSYSLFKTCNVWTSKCLKTGGIQNGFWTPSASGVMSSLSN